MSVFKLSRFLIKRFSSLPKSNKIFEMHILRDGELKSNGLINNILQFEFFLLLEVLVAWCFCTDQITARKEL
jgi:hypothetical protein